MNHLFFCFETTVLIYGFHVGLPNSSQVVLEVLEVSCFSPPLLLSFNDMFVKVIQPLYDLLVGTCDNK